MIGIVARRPSVKEPRPLWSRRRHYCSECAVTSFFLPSAVERNRRCRCCCLAVIPCAGASIRWMASISSNRKDLQRSRHRHALLDQRRLRQRSRRSEVLRAFLCVSTNVGAARDLIGETGYRHRQSLVGNARRGVDPSLLASDLDSTRRARQIAHHESLRRPRRRCAPRTRAQRRVVNEPAPLLLCRSAAPVTNFSGCPRDQLPATAAPPLDLGSGSGFHAWCCWRRWGDHVDAIDVAGRRVPDVV